MDSEDLQPLTIEWFQSFAYGQLNLLPDQFGEMRPAMFWLMMEGYNRQEENRFRQQATLIRMQTTELINIQLEKKDRVQPQDLWEFPWEEEQNNRFAAMSETELIDHNKKMIKQLNESMNK